MKILLINNCHQYRGGADTVYLNTAQLLREYGHDVILFSFENAQNVHTECKEYFVKRDGTIKTLRNYFFNPNSAKKIDEVLTLEKPDIAHAHLMWGGMTSSIFSILRKHQVPLVHTAHDYRMVCPAYLLKDGKCNVCERCTGGKYYNCALHRCSKGKVIESILMTLEMYYRTKHYPVQYNIDGLIFVSNFSKNKHYSFDGSLKTVPCSVIYNCPGELVEKSIDLSFEGYNSYYLFYGRLSEEKGIRTLIQAFEKHPRLQLKIIGTGLLEKELLSYCEGKSIKNITFGGYKSGRDLFDLVAHAKYVCVPSECYENNPMTIVESYTLGVPVIGAAIGGITEVIENEITGYTFESGSLDSLLCALERSNSVDRIKYKELKENARQFGINNFSRQKYIDKLLDFYKEIIYKQRNNG